MSDDTQHSISDEQRKSVRKVMLSKAIFVSHDVRSSSAVTLDISTGGLSVTLPSPLEIGQACAISFDVPTETMRERSLINGTVSSCVPRGDHGYRIGIHYVQSDDISKQLIAAAVDTYLDEDA